MFQHNWENILIAGTSAKDYTKIKIFTVSQGLVSKYNHFLSFCGRELRSLSEFWVPELIPLSISL